MKCSILEEKRPLISDVCDNLILKTLYSGWKSSLPFLGSRNLALFFAPYHFHIRVPVFIYDNHPAPYLWCECILVHLEMSEIPEIVKNNKVLTGLSERFEIGDFIAEVVAYFAISY